MKRAAFLAYALVSSLALDSHAAMAPGNARDYRLEVSHAVGAELLLDGHPATELLISVTNNGERPLFDLRLYLESVGYLAPLVEPSAARIRQLLPGQKITVAWTYESMLSLNASRWKHATFRIEAIDGSTQRLVTFSQISTRGT